MVVTSGLRSDRCAYSALLDGRFVFHAATVEAAAVMLRAAGATTVTYRGRGV